MKRRNATRNALFTSIISLLLCVSMLVGTTFAWFTDSVVSGNNVIAAGNLDIELYNDGKKVNENTNLFDGVLWEPGVVDYENFTIKNEGNLALLYNFAMNWGDYNTLAGQYNLTQVLKVAMVDKHVSGDRAAAIAAGEDAGWAALDSWSFKGEMTNKGETKDFALIIYWEPSDNDNNWNVQNGKTLDKGEYLYVNLGINLQATQKMHESDSFGTDYDALANPWDGSVGEVPKEEEGVITISTAAELAAFADAVNNGTTYSGKTVKLGANINLNNQPWTAIGDCESGKYFQGTFDGQGYTIYNLSVDYSDDTSEHATAGLFGWVDAAGATIKNVNLENATVLGSHWVGGIAGYFTGRIENCSVNNSTIMGFNVNSEANGDKVGGIVGWLNEHSYINNNSVSGTEITGNRDIGGIAGSVAATIYEMKNNKVTDTNLCYSEEKSYASAGEIVSGRTGYAPDNTNTATNVTIVRMINVKTVAELNASLNALSSDAQSTAAILQNCNEPEGVVEIPAAYTGTLTLKDSTIKSVQAAGNANIVIAGNVVVNAKGSGVATAAETETTFDGSAITANGELTISGTGNLTAIAADVEHAAGIGGDKTTKITIENVHIVDVKGSFAQSTITSNWGKSDPKGGAAIGSGCNGAVITLKNVTIDNAEGGSKAAGIGARYHTGVTINVQGSTIKNVVGGSSSAGIGGSRVSSGATSAENVTINIVGSNITAVGGDYGAGIGSGYSTYLRPESSDRPVFTINIDETSVINATGGVAAAGIGTGHNVVGLAGEINSENVTATVSQGTCPAPGYGCCGERVRTNAQNIGLGSLADDIIAKPITKNITYLGVQVDFPAVLASSADDLAKALELGADVTLTESISDAPVVKTAPYGNYYGVAQNGGVLDGKGNTLDFELGALIEGTADNYGIMTSGGTIKNVTITGVFRGIMIMNPTETVYIDNVTIGDKDVCYAINTGEGDGTQNLIVTDSTIKGWSSYGTAVKSVTFTNCTFAQGEYYTDVYGRLVKPYVNTVFEGCEFGSKFYIDLSALTTDGDGNVVNPDAKIVLRNCTVNGVKLTAENWKDLIAPESSCGAGQISIEGKDGSYMTASNIFDYVVIE